MRTPYPSDVSDDEWEFTAPDLTMLPEETGQRRYEPQRSVSCGALDGAYGSQPFACAAMMLQQFISSSLQGL
jgi:hypothetical protein